MSLNLYKEQIEAGLDHVMQYGDMEQKLIFESARYSLLNGGKRLRGAILMEVCRACGGKAEDALQFACAIEMIHAYSLVHDDLPCMDNDDLRRGKPTNHKVYGETIALLAGDALLNGAYEILLEQGVKGEKYARAGAEIARAAGVLGMIGGQVLDMETGERDLDRHINMINLKTGRLFLAACVAGAVLGEATGEQLNAAQVYAEKLAMAFQIQDDILDVVGDAAKLGKNTYSDKHNNKYTFVDALGVTECKKMVDVLTKDAVLAAEELPSQCLAELAGLLSKRES